MTYPSPKTACNPSLCLLAATELKTLKFMYISCSKSLITPPPLLLYQGSIAAFSWALSEVLALVALTASYMTRSLGLPAPAIHSSEDSAHVPGFSWPHNMAPYSYPGCPRGFPSWPIYKDGHPALFHLRVIFDLLRRFPIFQVLLVMSFSFL